MARKRPALRLCWTGIGQVAKATCLALAMATSVASSANAQTGTTVTAVPEFATLIADRLYLDGPNRLIAEGNVEAISAQTRLRAARVIYDRATGGLDITGPLVLTDGGRVTMLADSAQLTAGMRQGLIQSARVVLDDQLQIAALQVSRPDERFTEMSQVIASACEICADRPTPLWEMRATRVVHDQQEQQLHFENAQFRMFGLPVMYLPRLRVPDPTLERATGFLSPRYVINTEHGFGLRAPYFIALSADRDLTVTPFLATKGTRALDLRYRQAFASGKLELGGLLARDSIRPGGARAMGYAQGQFLLPRGYQLSFNLIQTSDRRIMDDYGRAESALSSDITVVRVRRDERFLFRALHFRSLRLGDLDRTLPSHIGEVIYERRVVPPVLGGIASLRMEAHGHSRRNPLAADVKAVGRFSLDMDWRRDAVFAGGVLGAIGVSLGLDHMTIGPANTVFPKSVTRITPNLMAELRWPLVHVGSDGSVQVIEPIAQVVWGKDTSPAVPNDLSRLPELDEGNLFSNNRFAARDQREGGLRANLGLSWTRSDADGWSSTVTVGRVWRQRDLGQFSAVSPLGQQRSDWLVSVSLDTATGLTLSNRALIGAGQKLTRNAMELDWVTPDYSISTSYTRIIADPAENRTATSAEWRFDGTRHIDDYWTARMGWRYDIARKRASRFTAGLTYENECLRMQMGLERQFSTAANPTATTNFGLTFDVLGVGGNPSRARRGCSG
jgi:LPS-assembly protein